MEKLSKDLIKNTISKLASTDLEIYHLPRHEVIASIMSKGLLSKNALLSSKDSMEVLALTKGESLEGLKRRLQEKLIVDCKNLGNSFFLTIPPTLEKGQLVLTFNISKFLSEGNKLSIFCKGTEVMPDSYIDLATLQSLKGVLFGYFEENSVRVPKFIINPENGIISPRYLKITTI